jgi:hypothetical protein
MAFIGEQWESDSTYGRVQSLLLDMFRGDKIEMISLKVHTPHAQHARHRDLSFTVTSFLPLAFVDGQGMDHVLVFTAVDGKVRDQPIATCPACPPLTPTPPLVAQILLRGHTIAFKKSGTKVPRVELVPMGPSMDLSVRRTQLAEDDLFKLACKKPKAAKVRSWCWCRVL